MPLWPWLTDVFDLAERDLEVLAELDAACRNHLSVGLNDWVRPLDCGGTNSSDHSRRLGKLVQRGLAEDRQRSSLRGRRGSKVYRITEAGKNLLNQRTQP